MLSSVSTFKCDDLTTLKYLSVGCLHHITFGSVSTFNMMTFLYLKIYAWVPSTAPKKCQKIHQNRQCNRIHRIDLHRLHLHRLNLHWGLGIALLITLTPQVSLHLNRQSPSTHCTLHPYTLCPPCPASPTLHPASPAPIYKD